MISEKSTVAGILRPVLDAYGAPFLPVHGFNSATKTHELAQDITHDTRRTVILYVGDYDPSGLYMSEIDLPGRLTEYGAGDDYTIDRIALTAGDVGNGTLPSFQAKTQSQDPRYRWFTKNFGRRAWELDAMNPNDLRDRIREKIEGHIDPDEWQQHKKIEAIERETTRRIAKKMSQACKLLLVAVCPRRLGGSR